MKKYTTSLLLIFTLSYIQSIAQDVFNLWEGKEIPFYKENKLKEYEKEEWGTLNAYQVTKPTVLGWDARPEEQNNGLGSLSFG